MRLPTEYLISHGWLLIPAAVVGLFALVVGIYVLSNPEQSGCFGFSYFSFIDQRADTHGYMIQLRNGVSPIIISGISVGASVNDNSPYSSKENVQPGEVFYISTKHLGLDQGEYYANLLTEIRYGIINGAQGMSDTGVCFGMVR
jgi:hypothetical protein